MFVRALLGAWTVLCALLPSAAHAERGNPYEHDENAIKTGTSLFAARCADCHGPDAKGNRGPDLTRVWLAGGSDERVFGIIRNGVAGSIMPPSVAPDTELWAIVAYLRSISTVPPFAASGDAARGSQIFTAQCAECHRVGAVGGTLGPELTRIAEMRSREAVELAMRDPNASVAPGFRAVTLVTRRGERVEGVAKNEDAFSIQVATLDERLRAFRKSELAELTRETESLMPVFGPERLSATDFADVVAFLGTLRSPAARESSPAAASPSGVKP
jgi:putative heme-binding domain-containing protein